jgi:Protein of unknown function (DUF3237)
MSRLDTGEIVDPAQYYFRTQAQFETAIATYDWLNRVLAVGVGFRKTEEVTYSLFEVL